MRLPLRPPGFIGWHAAEMAEATLVSDAGHGSAAGTRQAHFGSLCPSARPRPLRSHAWSLLPSA